MKLLDYFLGADLALIGDFYYDINHDDIVEASEEGQQDFQLETLNDGRISLRLDLHQEAKFAESTYPQFVVQTSVGEHECILFTMQNAVTNG